MHLQKRVLDESLAQGRAAAPRPAPHIHKVGVRQATSRRNGHRDAAPGQALQQRVETRTARVKPSSLRLVTARSARRRQRLHALPAFGPASSLALRGPHATLAWRLLQRDAGQGAVGGAMGSPATESLPLLVLLVRTAPVRSHVKHLADLLNFHTFGI